MDIVYYIIYTRIFKYQLLIDCFTTLMITQLLLYHIQNRQVDDQPPQNVNTQPTVIKHSINLNGTSPKTISNEKPTKLEVRPQSDQPADRNLVHVTKAQMKGEIP